MSRGDIKKLHKTHQIKFPKRTQVPRPWKKIEEMLEKKCESFEENIKRYLEANNELLSKRITELNGKLKNLQTSIEHFDKVNLEMFKAIHREVSHMNGTFGNHAKNTDNHLYEIEEKLRYLEDSFRRNNLRTEGVEEEEVNNETWDQCKEQVSTILKSKLKINNVKLERDHIIPGRKRSHNKDKPRTIVLKLHSHEDKGRILRNVHQLKDTGYYINEDFSKATLNIRAQLWDEVKRPRAEGYFVVIKYDIIVTNKRDKRAQE